MTFKKIIGKIHLFLGLLSGSVVFIVACTGAIWVFETEISDQVYSYRIVDEKKQNFLPPSELKKIAKPYFGENPIMGITYAGKNRAASVSGWEANGEEFHTNVYLNPYTGELLHVSKNERNFFDIVIELHTNLMLGETGRYMVDYATLIFLVLIITGIILWWPKNKMARKQRFWFRWKEGVKWKRKNYDVHTILGFYAAWIVIFIALTGLAWGFVWVDKTIYFTSTLGEEYQPWPEPQSTSDTLLSATINVDDLAFHTTVSTYKKPFENLYIYFPQHKSETYYVSINPSTTTAYNSTSYYYDQRSGKLEYIDDPQKMNNGQLLRAMYYDIHIGKILGLPGQLLVFLASIVVASLPVTGFYVWYGRRNKKQATKL
ncbi:MAG: PepSY-associated TM helix domain-containing protein [Bacteroidia bacterium]